jgi:hypothetical protein
MAVGCRRRVTTSANVHLEHARALVRAGDVTLVVDRVRPRPGARAFGFTHVATVNFRTPVRRGTARVEGNRVPLTDAARFIRVLECFSDREFRLSLADDPADPHCWFSPAYGVLCTGVAIRVALDFEAAFVLATVIRPPDVSVTPIELVAEHAVFAIETAHRRRVVRIVTDPFAVTASGHLLAGRGGPALPPQHRSTETRPADTAWLDELA